MDPSRPAFAREELARIESTLDRCSALAADVREMSVRLRINLAPAEGRATAAQGRVPLAQHLEPHAAEHELKVLRERGERGEKGVASAVGGAGTTAPAAEAQERAAGGNAETGRKHEDAVDADRLGGTAAAPDAPEINAERDLRTLRTKIAVDPEAFFAQADADRSQDLSWAEWQQICRVHVENISPDTVRTLYDEVAQARDTTGTISHTRFLQVAEEYRAVRYFVEESECMGVLVDGLISKVNELRSQSTPPDDRQGGQAADGGAAHVLQLLSNLSETDLQALSTRLASPLCDRAAKMKRERTDRAAQGLDPDVMHEKTDGTGNKFADLPEAAYGTRDDFFAGLERVGVPHPKAPEEMQNEFTRMEDSEEPFESWNSGKILTTPAQELDFVMEPFQPESVSQDSPPCKWTRKHDYGGGRIPIRLEVFLHATCASWRGVRFGHFKCAYEYYDENGKRNPLWLHAEEVSMVKVVLLRFVKSQLDGMSLRAAFKQGGLALEDKEAPLKADKILHTLGGYLDRTDGPRSTSTFAGAVDALGADTVATEAELEALIDYFHAKFKQQNIKAGEVIATRLYTGPG